MSGPIPAEFWNARFSEDGFSYGDRASRLLLSFSDFFRPGQRALVPACGEGRDAVFLAKCGLEVTGVDISSAGLEKTQQLAKRENVSLTLIEADLGEWDWPVDAFDHVVANFLHVPSPAREPLHANMIGALKPGGYLFLEGFRKEQLDYQAKHQSGGPPDSDMLFAPSDLGNDFANAETIAFWTGEETLTEGPYHTGPAALVRAVFRKPETQNE